MCNLLLLISTMPNKSENNEIEPNHEIGLHGRRCSQHPQICIRSYPTHDNVECSKCEADRFFFKGSTGT